MMTTLTAFPTLDRVFDEVLRSALRGGAGATTFPVATDILENNDSYTFQFDVPGVKIEDIEITLEKRVLAVHGERRLVGGENGKVTRGRPHGRFVISCALPDGIDGENLTADLADGVLTIRVPKPPKSQPRKIQIATPAERSQLVG
jgi:HSP20 family protein